MFECSVSINRRVQYVFKTGLWNKPNRKIDRMDGMDNIDQGRSEDRMRLLILGTFGKKVTHKFSWR